MDELFDCDVEDNVTELQHSHGAEASNRADTTSTAQETSEDTDGPETNDVENAFVAHSLPISIPQLISDKGGFKDSPADAQFVPPHELSLSTSLIGQSVPLSSSSRLRTRNKLLRSTGFLPTACTHTEGFMVSNSDSGEPCMPRTKSSNRLRIPAETELLQETQSEPLLPIINSSNSSNLHFLRGISKSTSFHRTVSIPDPIHEVLG